MLLLTHYESKSSLKQAPPPARVEEIVLSIQGGTEVESISDPEKRMQTRVLLQLSSEVIAQFHIRA